MTVSRFARQSEVTELAVACSLVCVCGVISTRLLHERALELGFAVSGSAIVLIVLGFQALAQLNSVKVSIVDGAIVTVWMTDLVGLMASTYKHNSLSAVADLGILTVVYALFRILMSCWPALKWMSLALALSGAALGCAQAWLASHWFSGALRAGFTDMSSLKARCPTLIVPLLNDWATVLLLFMPFSLLISTMSTIRYCRALVLTLSVVCNMVLMFSLLLTLSRGAYLGLAVFWFVLVIAALAFRVDARLVCTRFTISFVLAVIAVSIIVPSIRGDLKQMVRGRQSASQTRSTEGHFAVWRAAWTIARSHPLLGVGPGNFAMHYVPEVGKSSERAFVGRPLNLFVQIVVERGIVGAASFLMLLLALFRSEIRVLSGSEDKQQRSASIIRLSALSAVLARELSYSSLLINPLASLLFWLLMAGVATDGSLFRRTGPEPVRHVRVMRIAEKVTGLAWMLLLAGSFLIFYIAFIHANAAGKANEAVQYWAKGEYQAGFESIGAAIRNDPGNAYYISMLGLEQGRLGLQSIQSSALSGVTPDVASRQIGFLNSAIGSYQSAGVANPLDDNFANNLGWLYFFLGDNKNAEGYLRRALEINSGEALYHIGLGILLEGRQRISDANIEYSAALTVRPEFIDSPSFLSLEQERPDRARTIIASSISMLQKETMRTSSPIAKARLGGLLLKSGHSREAIPFLQDAVKSLPGLSLTWANLGSALHDVGNDQAANTALKKSLFLRTNPESLNDAADSPHVKGDNNRIWDLQGIGSERRTAFRTTEHAARVSRVYRTTSLVRDDVLPPGFLEICIPSRK